MIYTKLITEVKGGHFHVSIFSGEDVDHFAKNGELVFTFNEWKEFMQSLIQGANPEITSDHRVILAGTSGMVERIKLFQKNMTGPPSNEKPEN